MTNTTDGHKTEPQRPLLVFVTLLVSLALVVAMLVVAVTMVIGSSQSLGEAQRFFDQRSSYLGGE